jgi:hypothetical protein
MLKWEYKTLVVFQQSPGKWIFKHNGAEYPETELVIVMNELGAEGWQHTAALGFQKTRVGWPTPSYRTETDNYVLFFMRPIESN